jgi:MYXO-CTERM domain-containing protein
MLRDGYPLKRDTRTRVPAFVVMLTTLAVVGCSQGPSSTQLDVTRQSVLGGYASPPEQNAVVLIVGPGDVRCTGVVVAPTLVLTARSCLYELTNGTDTSQYVLCLPRGAGAPLLKALDPRSFEISVGTGTRRTEAKGVRLYAGDKLDLCSSGVALLEVDTPLSPAPMALRLDSGARLNELGKFIGWGIDEKSPTMPPQDRLQRDVQVLAVGDSAFKQLEVVAGSFITGEAGCLLDQGGPFISDESNAVVGILADLDPADPNATVDEGLVYCRGALDEFRSLDAQSGWIRDAFLRTNQVPWLEGRPPLAAIGQSCVSAGDCSSGVCKSTTGGARFCSEDCSSTDCPEGTLCVGAKGEQWCVPAQVQSGTPVSVGCSASSGGQAHGAWLALLPLGIARRRRKRRTRAKVDSSTRP